jgi:hypothetical protein
VCSSDLAAEAADGLLSRAFLYAPKGPLSP